MEGRLTLTVVTPERAVVDRVECDEVTLPAERGELGILPGHTPLITLLGIGTVTWREGTRRSAVAVREGFAEISGDAVRILADRAQAKDSVDRAAASADRTAAEKRRNDVVGDEQLAAVNAEAAYADARLKVTEAG